MRIGIDVDEVCADLLGTWVQRYNAQYNDDLHVSEITEWDVTKFVKPECGKKMYDILTEHDLYEDIRPLPHAQAAVKVIRQMGHRVIFVSSCVRHSLDQKVEWLVRHGFLPDQSSQPDFVAAADKAIIGVDVLIDDHVKNVEAFPNLALLVDQPHNARIRTKRRRIRGLWEAPAVLAEKFG